jgi:hypothetical protein
MSYANLRYPSNKLLAIFWPFCSAKGGGSNPALAPWSLPGESSESNCPQANLPGPPQASGAACVARWAPSPLPGRGRQAYRRGQEVLDRDTLIRMREQLGARILTNSHGKVARVLGFLGGGAAGIVRAVKVSRDPANAATL